MYFKPKSNTVLFKLKYLNSNFKVLAFTKLEIVNIRYQNIKTSFITKNPVLKEFIENYFEQTYMNDNCKYKPYMWNYNSGL